MEEHDEIVSPIEVKGLGEIGIVGTAAAIANTIHHATNKRTRHLPNTIEKVVGQPSQPAVCRSLSMSASGLDEVARMARRLDAAYRAIAARKRHRAD